MLFIEDFSNGGAGPPRGHVQEPGRVAPQPEKDDIVEIVEVF